MNDPQVIPSQLCVHATPKFPIKAPNASFSVVEKMNRKSVNISMWDVVATIPSQKRLLQELETIELRDQPPNIENSMSLVQPSKEVDTNKKVRPPPFYVSLIIGDKIAHNFMIN